MSLADRMQQGGRYRVTFMMSNNRTPRVAVMKYLGQNSSGELCFDLRPHAGTQTIRELHIISAAQTEEPLSLPRTMRPTKGLT